MDIVANTKKHLFFIHDVNYHSNLNAEKANQGPITADKWRIQASALGFKDDSVVIKTLNSLKESMSVYPDTLLYTPRYLERVIYHLRLKIQPRLKDHETTLKLFSLKKLLGNLALFV